MFPLPHSLFLLVVLSFPVFLFQISEIKKLSLRLQSSSSTLCFFSFFFLGSSYMISLYSKKREGKKTKKKQNTVTTALSSRDRDVTALICWIFATVFRSRPNASYIHDVFCARAWLPPKRRSESRRTNAIGLMLFLQGVLSPCRAVGLLRC